MVFSMGAGGAEVLRALRARGAFRARSCGDSVGWAVGAPTAPLRGVTRRYLFNPRPWSAAALAALRVTAPARP
jgi:hypothetical protein